MRIELKKIGSNQRHTFYGTFERYGIKNGYKGPIKTVLLTNIEDDSNKIITTHLWFNLTKGFKKLNLKPGDKVRFNGRIKPYLKGYKGNRLDIYAPIEMDYLIYYPTKIEIIKKERKANE